MKANPDRYREDLPPIPWRLLHRPVVRRMPLPWFVAEIDGRYDFRVADGRKIAQAVKERLCYTCGQPLGTYRAFCIGPMCVITRTISEPPMHRECAEWSIVACPFLNQREKRRNTVNIPAAAQDPAGYGLDRQPGASCLWITKSYQPFEAPGGVLFKIGAPVEVRWYREGRQATRSEVLESIESGYPALLDLAEQDGPKAIRELEAARERAMALLPKEATDATNPQP